MPHNATRFALALHGRIGTLHLKPTQTIERHANASQRIARFCGASHRKHILDAQGEAAVDVFIHSWNPESAAVIEGAYGPAQSTLHQHPQRRLPKAQSQALSIARVRNQTLDHHQLLGPSLPTCAQYSSLMRLCLTFQSSCDRSQI